MNLKKEINYYYVLKRLLVILNQDRYNFLFLQTFVALY